MALKDAHPAAFGNDFSWILIKEKEKVEVKSLTFLLLPLSYLGFVEFLHAFVRHHDLPRIQL